MKEQLKNYRLPLNLDGFFGATGGDLPKCTEMESIDKYIEMLLITYPGEHRFDPEFGTKIWDLDFESVVTQVQWVETFRGYVREAVVKYEKRITDINVAIDVKEVVRDEGIADAVAIRRRVDVVIKAKLVSNGEKCAFGYSLYLGPLSNL